MIANLIDNGIRHNEPATAASSSPRGVDGEIGAAHGRATAVRVIAPEDAETLTEPFRRLDRTYGGFGLGLSIVRSVVAAHGGTIELTRAARAAGSRCTSSCRRIARRTCPRIRPLGPCNDRETLTKS